MQTQRKRLFMGENPDKVPHMFQSASDAEDSSLYETSIAAQEHRVASVRARSTRTQIPGLVMEWMSRGNNDDKTPRSDPTSFVPTPRFGGTQQSGFSEYVRGKERLREDVSLDFTGKTRWSDDYANPSTGEPATHHQRDQEIQTLQLLPMSAAYSGGMGDSNLQFPRSVSAPPAASDPTTSLEQWTPGYLRVAPKTHGESPFDVFSSRTFASASALTDFTSQKKSRSRSRPKEPRYSSIVEKSQGFPEDGDEDLMELEDLEEQDERDEGEGEEEDEGEEERVPLGGSNSETMKRKSRWGSSSSWENPSGILHKTTKGLDSKKSKTMSPHLLTERRRREKLNAQFLALRGVVPNITKMNKLSTLEDAIIYIKSLKEKVADLETQVKSNRYQEVENLEKATTLKSDYDSNDSSHKCASPEFSSNIPPEIVVSSAGNENMMTRIVCGKNRKGLLADIGAALELSSLDVQQLSLIKCSDSYYINVVSSRRESTGEKEEDIGKTLSELLALPLKAVSTLAPGP